MTSKMFLVALTIFALHPIAAQTDADKKKDKQVLKSIDEFRIKAPLDTQRRLFFYFFEMVYLLIFGLRKGLK